MKTPSEKVIENTCKEVNRVLHTWSDDKIRKEYLTLFRSYFSKFYRAEFGWKQYSKTELRKLDIYPKIQNKQVVDISFSGYSTLRAFNVDILSKLDLSNYNYHPKQKEEVNTDIQIDFSNILNIKF